jgi:uncharacterized metal-binding protein YceD (DUF177 family)
MPNFVYFLFKLEAKGLPLPSFKPAVMGKRREFEIAFVALKPGMHEFTFEVDDKFFADVETRDFSNCHAFIKLHLDKKTGFMLLKFEVGGKADVECDRCGNTLTMDLWDEFNMVVKMVDNPDEMNDSEDDPDVFYISKTESHLRLSDWIYEFVSLSVPLQKMCKEDEVGGPQCNKEVLARLNEMKVSEDAKNANALWKDLDKFKKKS